MRCKDCGFRLEEKSKDVWSKKFLDAGLCLICFRIRETEKDPESTKYLDMGVYRKKQRKNRKENNWKVKK